MLSLALILIAVSVPATLIILAAAARCNHCRHWHVDDVDAWFCAHRHGPEHDCIFENNEPKPRQLPPAPAATERSINQ